MATEKRLIDANALMEMLKKDYCRRCDSYNGTMCRLCWIDNIDIAIDAQPTVDAVEVVRCKDCKHCEVTPDCLRWCNVWGGINGMGDEGFCNYGERKSDGKA